MSIDFDDLEDCEPGPATPEEQAEWDEINLEREAEWEAEALREYGPPDERLRKNHEYAAGLVAEHTKPTIRGILKALSAFDKPMCCKNLQNHNLDQEPLERIIQPFELFGLNFRVLSVSEARIAVALGEGYDTVGSGGEFLLEQRDDGSFKVIEVMSEWIA